MLLAQPIVEIEPGGPPLRAQTLPGQGGVAPPLREDLAPGRDAGHGILNLLVVDAKLGEEGIGDELPPGIAQDDRLAFELLETRGHFTLAEGEVKRLFGDLVEDGDDRNPLFQRAREDARGGKADVRLPRGNERDRRRGSGGAALHDRIEIAEIAHVLAGPVRVVVEDRQPAARGDPNDLVPVRRENVGGIEHRERRQREPERGRPLHELATGNVAAGEIVYQIVETAHLLPPVLIPAPAQRSGLPASLRPRSSPFAPPPSLLLPAAQPLPIPEEVA